MFIQALEERTGDLQRQLLVAQAEVKHLQEELQVADADKGRMQAQLKGTLLTCSNGRIYSNPLWEHVSVCAHQTCPLCKFPNISTKAWPALVNKAVYEVPLGDAQCFLWDDMGRSCSAADSINGLQSHMHCPLYRQYAATYVTLGTLQMLVVSDMLLTTWDVRRGCT